MGWFSCLGGTAFLPFEPFLLANLGGRRLPGIQVLVVVHSSAGADVCARLRAEGSLQRGVPFSLQVCHELELGVQPSRAVCEFEETVQNRDFAFCSCVSVRGVSLQKELEELRG
jgi:hypothetical protein